jgi:SAM-dependent methyltransferase
VWSIPESELHVLGDVRDKDVLELGCGGAQWSIALTKLGARSVGLDNSARQLEHARRLMAGAGVEFPLVHASAESVPLADARFDIVFCDHGAMTFADPERTVPEAARLLRAGGLFAFSAHTPLHFICWDELEDRIGDRLRANYFESTSDDGEAVAFSRPFGEWIRLFRRHGFAIEDLIELRPPEGATSTYTDYVTYDWARAWPAEQIWRLRRT